MQYPPRTTSRLAHGASTSSSPSSAITSSWHIQRQSENAVDVFGDEYDTSPFDETALANNGLSPLSVANQSPLRLETPTDWEDEEDPFADCYHPHSRPTRPASASAPASSAGPSGLVSRASTNSRPAPVVPKRGGAYGRYADSSSRARRHHQTTPSTMTSSANGLRKPQTPMQMLYDLPYTPASTPSASPNSRRRATLPSPPPVPARPRVVEPDAPLVVHGTRPSPFPLGPTPPRRTGRAPAMASKPVPVHIVDVAVERFGLQLQTPSTAPSSAASSSTDSGDDTDLVTPTTTIASTSPVTTSASTTSGMMRRKPAVTALDMERERQWALWEAEHAPSATIAVTEPVEKKKLFSISSSKSSSVEAKETKPKKDTTKKRSSRWWCCFGGSSAHETDDEEEWNVEHEKSPRPASRLRKRAN